MYTMLFFPSPPPHIKNRLTSDKILILRNALPYNKLLSKKYSEWQKNVRLQVAKDYLISFPLVFSCHLISEKSFSGLFIENKIKEYPALAFSINVSQMDILI